MVRAAVAERQLVGLEPERPADELVAEADAEDRAAAVDQPAHLGGVRVHRARVAGAVREQDAVGLEREDLGRARVVRARPRPRRRPARAGARSRPSCRSRRRRRGSGCRAGSPSIRPETASASERPVIAGSSASSARASASERPSPTATASIAPRSRRWRTSARVSSSASTTTPCPQPVEQPAAPGGRRVARLVAEQRAHLRPRRLLGRRPRRRSCRSSAP